VHAVGVQLTAFAGMPPKVTLLAPSRLLPLMVTTVPPVVYPAGGLTAVTTGVDAVIPDPVRVTLCAPASSVRVRTPDTGPGPVGANVTCTVQDEPGAS